MSKPTLPPPYVDITRAAEMLGIHRTTFYEHIYPAVRAGKIVSIRIGRAIRINVASLMAWAERELQP
jgi:excisionase family DNA binding protein